ncbi:hypothetical protein [Arcticibacter tournemirensis]|uniref:Uncharacterized protein n=1 Tax=Arcticibacter tournemirensis TaxID=699437 RepID=A0A4Q0MAB9_9SPHI|nr:hypothetical protein [Arcticibacter tournemirensis]RXF70187.1 hypothetical protein EKH83_09940 [Arcticibacter tournemirensis]
MKTLTTITAAVLLASVFAASADERTELKSETTAVSIKAPVFEFGSPEDVNYSDVEKLKTISFRAPEFVWGSPEDSDLSELKNIKTATRVLQAPAFEWGSPEDVNTVDVRLLKFRAPAFVWGSPEEVNIGG